ncbi:hypothetical protein BDY17DRAFT_317044 [Neohortaea acidophila]|uniref:Rhodanese domain-containing protein n=1 Tax=Neohortaea acidophila TaxID=245834 RepID=A0A6A6PQJ9_9PEZI|nr:uncharacterized protein BDY17DRAFT_317044 [Neohortaea acidophila]KAF2482282.1 hypothetical protein BDY17DRAFT_317044 [Neohortaea acidophila]
MSSTDQPWHASFPASTLVPESLPANKAYTILSMKIASMLIIDVRRTDYEGGSIRGSLNIPAQGFWWNRGMLYELAYKADMQWVVFTCNSCSPGGRGPRCAAWFLEFVRGVAGDEDMQVMALEGGMRGWVKGGEQFTGLMDGFKAEYWEEMFAKEGKKAEQSGAAVEIGKV